MGPGLRYGQSGSFEHSDSSVWSLKEVGARNHLLLRGNKSFASQSRHRLRALGNGVGDRSSRQTIDIDARPWFGVPLGLTLLLALA
jgi:hypothetical protein